MMCEIIKKKLYTRESYIVLRGFCLFWGLVICIIYILYIDMVRKKTIITQIVNTHN